MKKLILDPGLFDISAELSKEDQIEHFQFLKNSIAFADTYLDVVVDTYNGAPYNYYYDPPCTCCLPPITKSLTVRNRFSEIQKILQRMSRNGQDINLSDKTASCDSLFLAPNSITTSSFLKYIHSLFFSNDPKDRYLLLLSQTNSSCSPVVSFHSENDLFKISAVSNPAVDCNGIIFEYLKACADSNEMFPQKGTCSDLNRAFQDAISATQFSESEKKPFYKKYGTEVASRNYYQSQPEISRKNAQYTVFVHAYRKYYLSIDYEHGAIEIFSCTGQNPAHLGEYDFACNYQKPPNPETHRLNV